MGVLSNRIERDSLKPGDHIYSWRAFYVYAHHGIYVGEDKVIHFTRDRGEEAGKRTVLDLLLISSGKGQSQAPCYICTQTRAIHGVVSSCLNCFLDDGALYRFEYAVNHAFFIAKARGGTCTLAVSDPDDIVVHRAKHLLSHGFGCYNIFKNNCEDFAIYCKTGWLVDDEGVIGWSGQAGSIFGGHLASALSIASRLVTTNVLGRMAVTVGGYYASRYAADISMRRDVVKVEAEALTCRLATGGLQIVASTIPDPPS